MTRRSEWGAFFVAAAGLAACAGTPPQQPPLGAVSVYATADVRRLAACTPCAPLLALGKARAGGWQGAEAAVLHGWLEEGVVAKVSAAVPQGSRTGLIGLELRRPAGAVRAELLKVGFACAAAGSAVVCEANNAQRHAWLFPDPASEESTLLGLASGRETPEPDVVSAALKAPLAADPEQNLIYGSLESLAFTELMRDPPEGWLNLSILANALRWTAEATLTLREEPGCLVLTIRGLSDSAESAEKSAQLLSGLSSFAQAAWNWSDPSAAPAWAQVFETAEFQTDGSSAQARWLIPAELIGSLAVDRGDRADR